MGPTSAQKINHRNRFLLTCLVVFTGIFIFSSSIQAKNQVPHGTSRIAETLKPNPFRQFWNQKRINEVADPRVVVEQALRDLALGKGRLTEEEESRLARELVANWGLATDTFGGEGSDARGRALRAFEQKLRFYGYSVPMMALGSAPSQPSARVGNRSERTRTIPERKKKARREAIQSQKELLGPIAEKIPGFIWAFHSKSYNDLIQSEARFKLAMKNMKELIGKSDMPASERMACLDAWSHIENNPIRFLEEGKGIELDAEISGLQRYYENQSLHDSLANVVINEIYELKLKSDNAKKSNPIRGNELLPLHILTQPKVRRLIERQRQTWGDDLKIEEMHQRSLHEIRYGPMPELGPYSHEMQYEEPIRLSSRRLVHAEEKMAELAKGVLSPRETLATLVRESLIPDASSHMARRHKRQCQAMLAHVLEIARDYDPGITDDSLHIALRVLNKHERDGLIFKHQRIKNFLEKQLLTISPDRVAQVKARLLETEDILLKFGREKVDQSMPIALLASTEKVFSKGVGSLIENPRIKSRILDLMERESINEPLSIEEQRERDRLSLDGLEWQLSKLEFVNEKLIELDAASYAESSIVGVRNEFLDISRKFPISIEKYLDYFPSRVKEMMMRWRKVSGKIHGPPSKTGIAPYRDYSMEKLIFDIENIQRINKLNRTIERNAKP